MVSEVVDDASAQTNTEGGQVLFKRKPIIIYDPPTNVPDNAEVWVMKGTNEVFTDYEKYLKRFDYLNQASTTPSQPASQPKLDADIPGAITDNAQKKFTDAVNGKGNLNFFDALESETESTANIEKSFPEVLRDPILRKVQFSEVGRLDDLVSQVFDEFKHDFFPGEEVIARIPDSSDHVRGVIREKAKFPMIRGPNGEVQRAAFSRYFVRIHGFDDRECLMEDKFVRRDKKVFTKQNLKSFLRHSLQRESYNGAPWLVKEPLAIQYRLPMEIPARLLQDAKLLAHKVQLASDFFAPRSFLSFPADPLPQQQMLSAKGPRGRKKQMNSEEFKKLQDSEAARMHMAGQQHPGAPHHVPQLHNNLVTREAKPPPPPPIKYPIEDLDLPPKRNGVKRPELEFFTNEMSTYIRERHDSMNPSDIEWQTIGMLLEVWNTLNVQCEVYVLDSFTFDDFVDAMRYQSLDNPCELAEEVHCAVLKTLVDDKGKSLLSKHALPEMRAKQDLEDESEVLEDESEVSTPGGDIPARSTRSRIVERVDPSVDNPRTTALPAEKVHQAAEMMGDSDWRKRLAARDFEDGGWQMILVGLLHNMSLSPPFKSRCERVLMWLAPLDLDPTRESARERWAAMDINLRVSALQMITILSIASTPIKEFLETCSEDMTDVRKRKIEHQRERKTAADELAVKDRERKILLPENMGPTSPKEESAEPTSANGDIEDSIEVNGGSESDPDDEAPTSRSLRRGNDRKRKREDEAARAAEEKARKLELSKQQPKQSKEFLKILKDIEVLKKRVEDHEQKILECDNDLREANVQRTKVLGKDRFCNRYYWYERNGQPFAGLPNSSTASYGYANGRIWVQGPDKLESEPLIFRPKQEQDEYQQRYGLTVPGRRELEEGNTILQTADEWGYYDDPDKLDNLIAYLDEKGEREKKLKRELVDWREEIVKYMHAHKKFKEEEVVKKTEAEEDAASRVATRHKAAEDQTAAKERCLRWTNLMALDDLGHLHSQPDRPKPKKPRQKGVAVPTNRTSRSRR